MGCQCYPKNAEIEPCPIRALFNESDLFDEFFPTPQKAETRKREQPYNDGTISEDMPTEVVDELTSSIFPNPVEIPVVASDAISVSITEGDLIEHIALPKILDADYADGSVRMSSYQTSDGIDEIAESGPFADMADFSKNISHHPNKSPNTTLPKETLSPGTSVVLRTDNSESDVQLEEAIDIPENVSTLAFLPLIVGFLGWHRIQTNR